MFFLVKLCPTCADAAFTVVTGYLSTVSCYEISRSEALELLLGDTSPPTDPFSLMADGP